jgi:hypothetical protein
MQIDQAKSSSIPAETAGTDDCACALGMLSISWMYSSRIEV